MVDIGGAVVGLTKEDIDAACPGAGDEYVKAFMTRIEWIRAAGEVLGLQMPSGKDMASRGRCIEILASYYKELNLEALRTAASDPAPVTSPIRRCFFSIYKSVSAADGGPPEASVR